MHRSLSRGAGPELSAGASPHSRPWAATTSPVSQSQTATSKAPRATATSRRAQAGPAEQRRDPPTVAVPCLSRLPVSHLAHENAAGSSGESASLSPPNSSGPGVPSLQRRLPSLRSRRSSSSLRLNARASRNDGTGTNRFLLWRPTLFSTLPLSLPGQGLAKAWSSP